MGCRVKSLWDSAGGSRRKRAFVGIEIRLDPQGRPTRQSCDSASAVIVRLFVAHGSMTSKSLKRPSPRMLEDRRFKLASSFDCRDRRATPDRSPRPLETEADCGGSEFTHLLSVAWFSKGAVSFPRFRPRERAFSIASPQWRCPAVSGVAVSPVRVS